MPNYARHREHLHGIGFRYLTKVSCEMSVLSLLAEVEKVKNA